MGTFTFKHVSRGKVGDEYLDSRVHNNVSNVTYRSYEPAPCERSWRICSFPQLDFSTGPSEPGTAIRLLWDEMDRAARMLDLGLTWLGPHLNEN